MSQIAATHQSIKDGSFSKSRYNARAPTGREPWVCGCDLGYGISESRECVLGPATMAVPGKPVPHLASIPPPNPASLARQPTSTDARTSWSPSGVASAGDPEISGGDLTRRRVKMWRDVHARVEVEFRRMQALRRRHRQRDNSAPGQRPHTPSSAVEELLASHRAGREEFKIDWIREAGEDPAVAARNKRREQRSKRLQQQDHPQKDTLLQPLQTVPNPAADRKGSVCPLPSKTHGVAVRQGDAANPLPIQHAPLSSSQASRPSSPPTVVVRWPWVPPPLCCRV